MADTDKYKPNRERIVPVEGAYNIRDLGAYEAAGGRRVKWGMVYRAGDLYSLTDRDTGLLARRGIKTIVDFRTEEERELAPDRAIDSVEKTIYLPIDAGNMIVYESLTEESQTEELMRSLYRIFPEQETEQYRIFMSILSDPANAPLLFHCSAGKDRTGFAAAILLAALGVDRETIYADYLLSAEYLEGKYRRITRKAPQLAPLMTVKREYLEAAFETMERMGGSIDAYLTDRLGADIGLLRSLYTEASE
ncbi:tyrosine-protein phosphatase [Treponema sp. OttesenSCG-928-L16]|nr:tyrosine-protein phosphatase [Treponema sp. OttesenSCG-928-L16]